MIERTNNSRRVGWLVVRPESSDSGNYPVSWVAKTAASSYRVIDCPDNGPVLTFVDRRQKRKGKDVRNCNESIKKVT